MSSQVTLVYIALLTISTVSKKLRDNRKFK